MAEVYTQANPFVVAGGDTSDHVDPEEGIQAWTHSSSEGGGIMIRVGCQLWPINHWKQNAEKIVKNFIENGLDTDQEDMQLDDFDTSHITEKLRSNDQAGAIREATKLIKTIVKDRTPREADVKKAAQYTKKLKMALEFIEQMVEPGKTRRQPAGRRLSNPAR